MPPLGFFVHRVLSDRTQRPDGAPVDANRAAGDVRPRRLIHERHEFIRESWHRARDADAAYGRASANSRHPSALRNVAVHHRPPASKFHNALRGTIDVGEIALL